MNKNLKFIMGAGLVVLCLAVTPNVVAQNAPDRPTNASQGQTSQANPGNGFVMQVSPDESRTAEDIVEKRAERLARRKANFQTRLTAAQQNRLRSRCQSAQAKLKSLQGRVNGIVTSRTEVYSNIVSRLSTLEDRLAGQNLDIQTLQAQITDLSGQVDEFKTQIAVYQEAISDMAEMDCAADPVAFQASLDEARTARTEIVVAAGEVKSFVLDSIKPTLQELKGQLLSPEDAEEHN